ncbi:hypothetical protein Tco_1039254 [Tanacetum coccineum]
MLRCFFLISGLKINIDKSNVLGVGVSDEEISQMARIIGYGVSKLPFKYLGVPVGCNMSQCVNWNAVTRIFTSKLSSWKARLLSIGGRLSLIKVVLRNLPTYFMSIYLMAVSIRSKLESMRSKFFRGADQNDSKMSWVKWEKCLSSKKKDGLGVFLGEVWNRINLRLLKLPLGTCFLRIKVILDNGLSMLLRVNVFLWRLNLNKLLSKVNLDRKGIEVTDIHKRMKNKARRTKPGTRLE